MPDWPATRVTLLDRLGDAQDNDAWAEFVNLYGPLIFRFARRRLPQDEDAADIVQEVLSAVMQQRYRRPQGRFQKWLVTVLLNKIRDFHARSFRQRELSGVEIVNRLHEEPSPAHEEEWQQDWQRQVFRVAAERVRVSANPVHWDAFERTVLQNQTSQDVAAALQVSLTNVYAIKSRLMKEIKDEIQRLGED